MSSELPVGLRRPSLGLPSLRPRPNKQQTFEPRSIHTSDDFLRDFLNPSFDPVSFLNARLPSLSKKQGSNQGSSDAVPLAQLSAEAQTLVSQLNAQNAKMSTILTQLTDDIMKSGSRLAYEVELLRGETVSFSETLHETLQDDIAKFVPGGLQQAIDEKSKPAGSRVEGDERSAAETRPEAAPDNDAQDPTHIKQLQTLTLVRSRLESVIKTFGNAMEFPFPPSEVSVSSGFLSVSAPDPSSDEQSSEEKGQQVLRQLRDEISDLLANKEDPIQGVEKAAGRIEELQELTTVWKGTAEENGRSKFIESLAKMVEDRHRELKKEIEQASKRDEKAAHESVARSASSGSARESAAAEDAKAQTGFGLMNQLQKLRGGL
ncbi:hypothetical protein DCS_03779 [Drechmeria coniospora]|uniref:Uncharacterized protein n=1 Tax=Drechmeria coniospora TaxID=98403 RepID=A0A151GI23_DRECN|nr:hypothetical protein DCS_03779 [Drechmeria coniospora]KYK56773.1 hypothetical protein DCS_03779 [Drechmeria coniospora]ODA78401.1 hypothetical protein RJ55_05782 [Drechmeria coniospora]